MSKVLESITQKVNYYSRPRTISINSFKILFYLTKRKGTAYFSEIKSFLNRSSSQVSQIMRRLRLKKYVIIKSNRPLKYAITELGRKVNKRTINDFLRYKDENCNDSKSLKILDSSVSRKNTEFQDEWLKYEELEEYYKSILIRFFMELPEILVDLDIDFTPDKYSKFVEETKACLFKYNFLP
ncbi:MAG: hypothetical protein ACFFCV_11655 [Promethearchaeota archaeon]